MPRRVKIPVLVAVIVASSFAHPAFAADEPPPTSDVLTSDQAREIIETVRGEWLDDHIRAYATGRRYVVAGHFGVGAAPRIVGRAGERSGTLDGATFPDAFAVQEHMQGDIVATRYVPDPYGDVGTFPDVTRPGYYVDIEHVPIGSAATVFQRQSGPYPDGTHAGSLLSLAFEYRTSDGMFRGQYAPITGRLSLEDILRSAYPYGSNTLPFLDVVRAAVTHGVSGDTWGTSAKPSIAVAQQGDVLVVTTEPPTPRVLRARRVTSPDCPSDRPYRRIYDSVVFADRFELPLTRPAAATFELVDVGAVQTTRSVCVRH